MKKLVYNIIALTLSAFFLVSSTGVKLFVHHCFKCEDTDYSLLAAGSNCCTHHPLHHLPQKEKCCTIAYGEKIAKSDIPEYLPCVFPTGKCCKKEVVFLKNDYEVLMDRQDKRLLPTTIALLPTSSDRSLLPENPSELRLFSYNDLQPPSRLAGKYFIIFTHHFKLA